MCSLKPHALYSPKQKPVPLDFRLDTKCIAKVHGVVLCCAAESKDQHANKANKVRSPFRLDVTVPKMYSAVDRHSGCVSVCGITIPVPRTS
jgi:hypothetical protein